LQLGREGRKLVFKDGDLALGGLHVSLFALKGFTDFDQRALFSSDLSLSLFVGLLFSLETAQVLLMLVLLALEPALGVSILHTGLVNELVSTA